MFSFPKNWSTKSKIEHLQRRLIIYSLAYYTYAESLVTDFQYDEIGKELMKLQKDYPNILATKYGYVFYDFEGSTGYYLRSRLTTDDLNYLTLICYNVVKQFRSGGTFHKPKVSEHTHKKKGKLF